MAHSIRILFISPNHEYGENIREMLLTEGYQVEVCADCVTGMDMLRQNCYHFLLLSAALPEDDQLELMAFMNQTCPDTLVIPVSWYAVLKSAVEAIHAADPDNGSGFANKKAIKMTIDRMTRSIKGRRRDKEAREKTLVMAKDLEESNLRLMELDRKKTDCLAFATHELRTPITIVNGYLKLLKGESFGKLNGQQQHLLAECERNCGRLLNLVNSMLDRCKLESEIVHLEISRGAYLDTVQSVVAQMQTYAHESGLSLNLDLPDEEVFVYYDANAIEQALINMIGNAVKFTDAPGTITVRCANTAEGLLTEVSDTGIGIDPNEINDVFDEFNKVGKAHVKRKGAGLGLSICKKIIEAHDGEIRVMSKPGEGSCFSFLLPLKQEKTNPA
jgi:two-component system cell cycle sensor histidine kinase PleC